MGSGASSGVKAVIQTSSQNELTAAFTALSDADRKKMQDALNGLTPSGGGKLTVLVFHGFTCDADWMKREFKDFEEMFKDIAEFHYLEAPTRVTEDHWVLKLQTEGKTKERGHTFKVKGCTWSSNESKTDYTASQEYLEQYVETQVKKPVDVLLSHSMGNVMVQYVLSTEWKSDYLRHLRGALFFAAPSAPWPVPDSFKRADFLTIHQIGLKDLIILPKISHTVAALFENPIILEHPEGDHMPRPFHPQLYEKAQDLFLKMLGKQPTDADRKKIQPAPNSGPEEKNTI